jgi:nucleotide-binding universal stress UspA family protein
MKTIIAPTDFSAVSLNAMNYAADLAVAIDAKLLLVNIVPLPVTSSVEVTITEETISELQEDTDKGLLKLKEELLLRTKNRIDIQSFSEFGTVEYDMEEICGVRKPFALVMSAKNSNAFERFIMGSNTLSAMRHIPYPVLVIPESCSFKDIHKIAFACDLEKGSAYETIKILKEWIYSFKASLDVVNVNRRADVGTESLANSISIQNQLAEFRPAFHFINNEKVEDGINNFLKKTAPDLLIVIHQSNSIFHKSHSKPLLLHSSVPVLSIPGHS